MLAYESGVTDIVDPLAGSYYVEWLTDRVEEATRRVMDEIAAAGGAVAAVESGLVQRVIEESAYRHARRVESGDAVVVGVNRFAIEESDAVPVLAVDPELEREQVLRLRAWRAAHDPAAVSQALDTVR